MIGAGVPCNRRLRKDCGDIVDLKQRAGRGRLECVIHSMARKGVVFVLSG